MKKTILVYKDHNLSANIEQLSVKRQWMEKTSAKHAYHCLPISIANTMGWGVSFPEDISFIWDGSLDEDSSHVKILKGEKYCSPKRGNGTISFITYLTFITEQNTTMLVSPVPNDFNENAQCFTTLISTSFYTSMIPIAWKIMKPNVEIIIPANTPVAALIPISLGQLEEYEMFIKKEDQKFLQDYRRDEQQNLLFYKEHADKGVFAHLYRKAENYSGEKVGEHEVKKIQLNTTRE